MKRKLFSALAISLVMSMGASTYASACGYDGSDSECGYRSQEETVHTVYDGQGYEVFSYKGIKLELKIRNMVYDEDQQKYFIVTEQDECGKHWRFEVATGQVGRVSTEVEKMLSNHFKDSVETFIVNNNGELVSVLGNKKAEKGD